MNSRLGIDVLRTVDLFDSQPSYLRGTFGATGNYVHLIREDNLNSTCLPLSVTWLACRATIQSIPTFPKIGFTW